MLSQFRDNNTFFVAPYFVAGTTAAEAFQYALPTNSHAHYINGMFGYNLNQTTRFNANFQYGIEMSDGQLGAGTATLTSSTPLRASLPIPRHRTIWRGCTTPTCP